MRGQPKQLSGGHPDPHLHDALRLRHVLLRQGPRRSTVNKEEALKFLLLCTLYCEMFAVDTECFRLASPSPRVRTTASETCTSSASSSPW